MCIYKYKTTNFIFIFINKNNMQFLIHIHIKFLDLIVLNRRKCIKPEEAFRAASKQLENS